MSFLSGLVNEFGHHGGRGGGGSGGYNQGDYNQGSSGGYGPPPPQVSPPWVARWDEREQRWMFINERTGERTHEHPGAYGGGGYEQRGGYDRGYGGGGYGGGGYQEERREERHHGGGHGMMYGAAGAAAGLAGGALLMHEGEKIGTFFTNIDCCNASIMLRRGEAGEFGRRRFADTRLFTLQKATTNAINTA